MSKLQDLINQYCPNGVEYFTLNEICEIKTGKGITKNESNVNGKYPIISGGVSIMGYCDYFNRNENNITIARAGTAGYVNYITTKFYLNDKCFSIIPKECFKNNINTKFLYFYLKNIEKDIMKLKNTGGVPTINTKQLSTILIPLPPLPIQQYIVDVLDKFTELYKELKDETELRNKQYKYYLNEMMRFNKEEKND